VDNLLVNAICVEDCSGFHFLISVISLLTILVMVLMRVMLVFDIHVFVISILFLCLDSPA
jgi:hypothetical protein